MLISTLMVQKPILTDTIPKHHSLLFFDYAAHLNFERRWFLIRDKRISGSKDLEGKNWYIVYTTLKREGNGLKLFGKEIVKIVNICICMQERCGGQLEKVHERHVGGSVRFWENIIIIIWYCWLFIFWLVGIFNLTFFCHVHLKRPGLSDIFWNFIIFVKFMSDMWEDRFVFERI